MNKKIILSAVIAMLSIVSLHAQEDNAALRDSLSHATEQLSFHPDSIDLRLRKASWNLRLEQWSYAKNEYDAVLSQNPSNVAALYFRAFANEKLHRFNFARIDYENLLRLVPGHFEARLGLALLNQKDKHHTEALDDINALATAHPDSAIVWAARAGMEYEQGMLDLAEYDYTQALSLDINNGDYLLCRADIRIKLQKFDLARQDLDAIVRQGTPRLALKEWYDQCR